ncbi:unnamed protein product [Symbiodinium sp. CCMP2592]|nr:unnamed protein product [Symbiodinium sp. CCMP2592]
MTGLRDIAPPSSGGKEVTSEFDSRHNVTRLQCKSVFSHGTCKAPAKENDNRVYPQANAAGKHSPGVYRCIHAPRVAIRAAPAANAEVLDTIRPGDLVRVAEIEAGHWARLDDDEVWARWTMNWPRWPKGVTEDGEDIGAGAANKAAVPTAAYILIDGTQVGLKTQLIERLPDDEAEKAQWPFGKALEHHCAEVNAAYQRQVPEAAKALRQRFVDAALKYVGIPYHRSYHDPASAKCKPGSKLKDAPLFLDNIQLVQKVVEDLKQEFGFLLISNCKPVHCRTTLPISFEDPADCEPGDLIFHEELDVEGAPSGRISHVEIFIGGATGRESLGSMPWNAHPRTQEKDGVQIFEDYRIAKETGKVDYRLHCHSIRTWLLSEERWPSTQHMMNRPRGPPPFPLRLPAPARSSQPIVHKAADAADAALVQQRVLGSCCSVPDLPDPSFVRASNDASAASSHLQLQQMSSSYFVG